MKPQTMNYPVQVGACTSCGDRNFVTPLRREGDPEGSLLCSVCIMAAPSSR